MKFPLNYQYLQKFIQEESHLFDNILYFRKIGSTNTEAFRIAKQYKGNFIIVADYQSQGRGRFERKWFSPDCENLYFSMVLNKKPLPENNHLIMVTANSVIKILQKAHLTPFIKWPNDIIIDKKKICGILIEDKYKADEKEFIVIGVGININTDFKKINELSEIAISLSQLLNKKINREEIFINFVKIFESESKRNIEEIYRFYKSRIYKLNQKIKLKKDGDIIAGVLYDIDKNCNLILKRGQKLEQYNSCEIILR